MPHDSIISKEKQHSILGVPGRMFAATAKESAAPGCFTKQRWVSESRDYREYHESGKLRVVIRFDDECGNRHNSFSITAEAYHPGGRDIDACGCLHDEIERVFPELAGLIKYHLCSTDGPVHYLSNTIYHAGDRDHWGLRKGETRQIKNGKTGITCWEIMPGEFHRLVYSNEKPAPITLEYSPLNRVGEGKERRLDYARSSACWPEATDEELTAPGLKERLIARLPGLLNQFRETTEGIGFQWERVNQ